MKIVLEAIWLWYTLWMIITINHISLHSSQYYNNTGWFIFPLCFWRKICLKISLWIFISWREAFDGRVRFSLCEGGELLYSINSEASIWPLELTKPLDEILKQLFCASIWPKLTYESALIQRKACSDSSLHLNHAPSFSLPPKFPPLLPQALIIMSLNYFFLAFNDKLCY